MSTRRRKMIVLGRLIVLLALSLGCSLSSAPLPNEETSSPERENPPTAPTSPLPSQNAPPEPVLRCGSAEPPFVTDLALRQPPSLSEPVSRAPFRDPLFGRCIVRVTDRTHDKTEPGGLKNEYARVQSFNADETRLLVMSTEGAWYLYHAQTLQPLGLLPIGIEPRWSATKPDLIYFSEETRLMAYNIATQQTVVIHEFADDFPGQNLAAAWTRYEGSPSFDGQTWGWMAEDADWLTSALLVYDLPSDKILAALDTRGWTDEAREIDSVTISPLGNYFLVYIDKACEPGQLGTEANPCGLMVFNRDLKNGRGLLRLVGHSDTALDPQGREVLVFQDVDTDHISLLDLETGVITPLWPIDFSHTAIGLHFSGRASRAPGWALVSTHDGDPASYTWMDDSVFAIELKAGGRIVRLAHTQSLVDETIEHDYWAEPQATVNRDFTRILFTSNWGRSGTGQVEMFMIELPGDWMKQFP